MKFLLSTLYQFSYRSKVAVLLALLSCQSAYADLPTIDPPSSGSGGGLVATIKGYLQDGVVLGGLVLAAVAFLYVAQAALATFSDVREGQATWMKFGSIVVVGIALLVAVIWLLGKSASIIL